MMYFEKDHRRSYCRFEEVDKVILEFTKDEDEECDDIQILFSQNEGVVGHNDLVIVGFNLKTFEDLLLQMKQLQSTL